MGAGVRRGNRSGFHYGWIIVFMGMVASMGAHGFGRMAYTLILPEMCEGLGITYTQAGLLGTGNFIGYLAFALIGGFLAARYGSRIVISLSLFLMGVTMVLTGMAQSFELAFVLRLLTGIGNGGAYVPAMALGSTWFAMKRRGFATGIVSGGTGAGTFISGLLVPAILIAYAGRGWSYAWYYLGVLVLIIAAICAIFLRNKPADLGLGLVGSEPGGTALDAAAGADRDADADSGAGSEAGADAGEEGGAGGVGYGATGAENAAGPGAGVKKPGSMQWSLVYRLKEVWYLGFVYFLYGFSYVIYMTFFKAFLVDEIGLTGAKASALWAMVGVLSIFCGIIWGGISDLLGRRYGAALAYFALACSYLIFAHFDSIVAIYLSAILFGLSAWSIPTIMAATAGDYVGPLLAPAGVGFVTLFFGIGQAFGPALGGYIGDTWGTFTLAFSMAALISLAGAGAALFLKKPAAESSVKAGA
ncbi:MAG: YbfB/YjiJ family MFS transporter [Firmicutes bacterium]|nr:YbfB/YjiJ family MFS transporter [Bacillota bacterium]